MQRVEQLEVWREAHTLVLETYELVSGLPDSERFGLISQMRRAAVSIPANIAEGFKRRGVAEKIRFYNISEASLEELRYYFLLCRDLGYEIQYDELSAKAERLARMLQGAINAIRAHGP
ncbi:MAG: four helix bundle protein [Gammaproteobacteria bacterium]|nr:four helix bundle protein [Gammaproteobacteria bacterium]